MLQSRIEVGTKSKLDNSRPGIWILLRIIEQGMVDLCMRIAGLTCNPGLTCIDSLTCDLAAEDMKDCHKGSQAKETGKRKCCLLKSPLSLRPCSYNKASLVDQHGEHPGVNDFCFCR